MSSLVCLLEEPSAKAMLTNVLEKIVPDSIAIRYIVFDGKQDLEKQIERKLRGWNQPSSYFLIMRDQDSGNCHEIKANLLSKVESAGKKNVSLVRIACHELESFYLGDLLAVENGLDITGLTKNQNNRKYRTPDNLSNPAEELSKLTKKKYQKVSGSRAIGPFLKLDNSNKSVSFNVLVEGVKKLIELEIEQ
ncbi:MAG: hypothetical protein B6229_00030 [Spirochaetaceae bacterium 4572_7]|nr:MAG: hypothetical protein B6229_00030 [Spirochaetaceae bacterium 4572_7]